MDTPSLIGAIVASLIFAVICARIAGNRGRSAVGFGILGFLTTLLGLVITLIVTRDKSR